jgi:hypothetical protein
MGNGQWSKGAERFMAGVARVIAVGLMVWMVLGPSVRAQPAPLPAPAQQAPRPELPLRASILRGEYGPHRANNDLLFYQVYVEHRFGYEDALKYINGYKPKVQNRLPIITERGMHRSPPGDQYFKGALFINTLRSIVDDDTRSTSLQNRSSNERRAIRARRLFSWWFLAS